MRRLNFSRNKEDKELKYHDDREIKKLFVLLADRTTEEKLKQLKELELDELKQYQFLLTQSIISLKEQLKSSQIQAKETGIYADPRWYQSVKKMVASRLFVSDMVKQTIKEKNIALDLAKKRTGKKFNHYFREVAREILPEELYNRIVEEAQQKLEENNLKNGLESR